VLTQRCSGAGNNTTVNGSSFKFEVNRPAGNIVTGNSGAKTWFVVPEVITVVLLVVKEGVESGLPVIINGTRRMRTVPVFRIGGAITIFVEGIFFKIYARCQQLGSSLYASINIYGFEKAADILPEFAAGAETSLFGIFTETDIHPKGILEFQKGPLLDHIQVTAGQIRKCNTGMAGRTTPFPFWIAVRWWRRRWRRNHAHGGTQQAKTEFPENSAKQEGAQQSAADRTKQWSLDADPVIGFRPVPSSSPRILLTPAPAPLRIVFASPVVYGDDILATIFLVAIQHASCRNENDVHPPVAVSS